MKSTWKILNELICKKGERKQLPSRFSLEDGSEINNPNTIANRFNEFFVNVGPNLAKKFDQNSNNFTKHLQGDYQKSMFLKSTSNKEIEEIIASMKSKSKCGIDGISSKLIKHISHIISIPLCHVFNLPFTCGIIPRELKMSLVTPIYKTGDKTKFTNYRPISVLPCFGKILEKIMFKRLTSYITKHDISFMTNNTDFGINTQQVSQ